NGRYVANRPNLEPRCGKRLDRGLATAPRTLHSHMHPLHPHVHGLATALLGRHGRREWSRLLRPLEAGTPRAPPRNHVAMHVRNANERVVERRRDVSHTLGFHAPASALRPRPLLRIRHSVSYGFSLGLRPNPA